MDENDDRATEEVRRACRVIARGGIRAISVVTGQPLSDDQLRSVRAYAAAHGVYLSTDGAGTVRLRAGLRDVGRAQTLRMLVSRLRPRTNHPAQRLAGSDPR